MNNQTVKVMKIEYRGLGTGWKSVDYLDVNNLAAFIELNKVQEYYIYEINITTLELEVIDTLFKGIKYVALTERTLGSSKYDRDDTPVKQTVNYITAEEVKEVVETIIPKTKQTKDTKFNKTSFFITKANGEKEYHLNGYEFILPDNQKVIVHKVNDKWNTTLKENGLSIVKDMNTRQKAIEETIRIMKRIDSIA